MLNNRCIHSDSQSSSNISERSGIMIYVIATVEIVEGKRGEYLRELKFVKGTDNGQFY